MPSTLRVANWDRWQSYRQDRSQPPWIKLHRRVIRNEDWLDLTDAEKGQLVSIWILAADKNGELPDSPRKIQKACGLDTPPDINRFCEIGFLTTTRRRQRDANVTPSRQPHGDANVTPERRQHDRPDTEVEGEVDPEEIRSDQIRSDLTAGAGAPALDFDSVQGRHIRSGPARNPGREPSRLRTLASSKALHLR